MSWTLFFISFLTFNEGTFVFSSHKSTSGLQSAGDPYSLHEPRAIGERGFANRL